MLEVLVAIATSLGGFGVVFLLLSSSFFSFLFSASFFLCCPSIC